MPNILNKLSKSVINALSILIDAGYEAYCVGGCVRDALLNRKINDYDICTNALPEQTKEAFASAGYNVVETGIKHGTVTVINNNVSFEVTTYRTDGVYLDNRHPESVEFVRNLEEDLKRRDFTINALACDIEGNVIDKVNGIEDLNEKVIRTVGNPIDRFTEDALRMIRAYRFSITLGFLIEDETNKAIDKLKENIRNVSIERLNQETYKILSSIYPFNLEDYKDLLTIAYDYNITLDKKDFNNINKFPDAFMKIAYLFSFFDEEEYKNKLDSLKISNDNKKTITNYYNNTIKLRANQLDNIKIKRYLSNYGLEDGVQVIQYICYLNNIDILTIKDKVIRLTADVVNLENLAVNGDDIKELGFVGKEIGIVLKTLVEMVIIGKVKNEKSALLKSAKSVKVK